MQIQRATYPLSRTVSKSANYTATFADDIIFCTGASWTLTLPTAVGIAGKQFTIFHNGTSLSQIYTLNTTGAQTIGGIASGVYILYTNRENLTVISDGANWIILNHEAISADTPYTITPSGSMFITNATYTASWRRIGKYLQYNVRVAFTGATDAASLFFAPLPGTLHIDASVRLGGAGGAPLGSLLFFDASATGLESIQGVMQPLNGTNLTYLTGQVLDVNAGGQPVLNPASVTFPQTIASGDRYVSWAEVPILEFQP